MSNTELSKRIIETIKILINANNKHLKFNQKKKGFIKALNEDGTVDITINNELFKNVEVRAGLLPFVGEVVRVEMPNGNTKEMFIDTAKNTIIGDGETLHTHSNLTTLQSITQSLINAWNSAASHISDDIKHITSDERTLWNTVENKVDSSRVLTDVPIGAKFTDTIYTHPISHPASIITESTTKKFVTDTEKDTWNAKETPIDAQAKVDAHANKINNPHNVTKAQVGLGNVDDKSSVTILSEITNSNVVNALGYTPLNSVLKGSINGVAELDENGKVLSSQLPSYVDDVLEFQSIATFPTTGESGKIYVATDTNLTYRWTGTIYIEISPSVALGETSSTAYRGDRGKTAYEHSQNIHARTDATKVETSIVNGNIKINDIETTVYTHPTSHPASIITQDSNNRFLTDVERTNWNDANSKKHSHENKTVIDSITQVLIDTWNTVTGKADKSYVDTELDKKANTIHEHVKSDVGLGNVDNTSDINKPISTAQQAALDLKANLDSPTFTGNPTAPTQTNGDNSTSIATTEFVQSALSAGGYGDMLKSQYDADGDGIVDNAKKVNGLTVETAVPSGAKFTDTVYSHPSTHPYSMITGTPTSLPANGGSATTAKHLIGDDTRNDNFPPSEYMSGGSRYEGRAGWQTEFKRTTTIGVNSFLSGTYCFLETKTPWPDSSGGYPIQIAYGNGHPCWRVGISTTEWSLWQVLISKPYYAGTSAPSNTNLLWIDTN